MDGMQDVMMRCPFSKFIRICADEGKMVRVFLREDESQFGLGIL